jgi:hypothetical protein
MRGHGSWHQTRFEIVQDLPASHGERIPRDLVRQREPNNRFKSRQLMNSRPLIEWVLRTAEDYESLFASSQFRGIDASKLIKIRLAGS